MPVKAALMLQEVIRSASLPKPSTACGFEERFSSDAWELVRELGTGTAQYLASLQSVGEVTIKAAVHGRAASGKSLAKRRSPAQESVNPCLGDGTEVRRLLDQVDDDVRVEEDGHNS